MAGLNGKFPGNTYGSLLNFNNNNTGVDTSLQTVYDGNGTATGYKVSTTGIGVGNVSITAIGSAVNFQNTSGNISIISSGTLALSGIISFSNPSQVLVSLGAQEESNTLTALSQATAATDTLAYFTDSLNATTTPFTAAARTVLDDTTVAAMVDTLGGASSTGTGGLVRATSPTFVTPVLGTPSSGTLSNCTSFPAANLTGLGTGVATFLATPSSANLAAAITNETGSGALVFATSPTLVTPLLGTPTSGTLTSCTGYTVPNLVTSATNDSASAGQLGEYVESNVLGGSAVSLSTGTSKTITSISLTAGDWEVVGNINFTGTGTTVLSLMRGGINTTTDTLPTSNVYLGNAPVTTVIQSSDLGIVVPTRRMSLSGTTTVYLVAQATFTTSTLGGYGHIHARRVR